MNNTVNHNISELEKRQGSPLVIVISGPSGVGKDTILNRMKQRYPSFEYIVTVTTRPKRATEKDGIDYHFISEEEFQGLIKHNGLLEWARVYNNWYGVPRDQVKKALDKGKDVIIKVDVQGAATIKNYLPEALFIFIAPPSFEELTQRLVKRNSESPSDLKVRLETAANEMQQITRFDYVVLNYFDGIDRAIEQIMSIISAEKCRVHPRKISL